MRKYILFGIIALLFVLVSLYLLGLFPSNNLYYIEPSFATYSQYGEVPHEDIDLTCISSAAIRENYESDGRIESIIIDNEQEYRKLLEYKTNNSRCNEYVFPEINFTEKTLLGKYASGGGCKIDFIRKVYKDETNKKIIYVVGVKEEGRCKMLGSSMNWILIPKVPEDYSIEIKLETTLKIGKGL